MTSLPITHRWVGTDDASRQAANAFLAMTLRRRRIWVLYGVTEVVVAVILGAAFTGVGPVGRVVWALVYAFVPVVVVVTAGLGAGYALNRRNLRRRLHAGVTLESEFVERAMTLRGPLAESTLQFDGIAWVRPRSGWVFLKPVGSPITSMWPAELFPPADLQRLQDNIEMRRRSA